MRIKKLKTHVERNAGADEETVADVAHDEAGREEVGDCLDGSTVVLGSNDEEDVADDSEENKEVEKDVSIAAAFGVLDSAKDGEGSDDCKDCNKDNIDDGVCCDHLGWCFLGCCVFGLCLSGAC